ncbi:MAG: hypothetical protein HOI53_04470, partial [Francisellaceae bacterium]|nr:hypothetical protein [Francisellaceae bacterium]
NLVAIEAAAYLQIAFTSFGIRIGGCPNGCDIESPLTLILNSLRIFYNSNGYFPSHVQLIKSKQYIKDRKYLNKKIAEQFISGYCQDILDRASQGCFGVSYLDKTLGNGVFKELEHLIKLYSIDVDLESIYEDNHKISLLENINITNQLTDYEHTIEAAIKKYKSTNKSSCFAAVFIKDKKPTSLAHTFKHDDAMLLKQLESKFGLRTFEELHRCFEKEKHSTPSLSSSAKRLSRFASRFKKGNIINTRVSDIENDKKVLTHDDKINAFIAQAEIKSNAKINQYEK